MEKVYIVAFIRDGFYTAPEGRAFRTQKDAAAYAELTGDPWGYEIFELDVAADPTLMQRMVDLGLKPRS